MLVVGLTGGIGSGKSTVAKCFQKLGTRLVSADDIAKDMLLTDRRVRDRFVREFGPGFFEQGGGLERRKLAHLVFENPRALQRLNAIVHPAVVAVIREEIGKAQSRRGILMIEAALFYETGLENLPVYMIVVDADEEIRIRRVMKRDRCTRNEVERRIKMQLPASRKVNRADFVIFNSGPVSELPSKCLFLYGVLTRIEAARRGT